MAMFSTKLPYCVTEADVKELVVGRAYPPDQVQGVLDQARAGDLAAFCVEVELIIQAIDPATGDSLLHIAAQLASMEAINKTMARFDRHRCSFYVWAQHTLLVHQSHSGDTVPHIAARSGNQNLLTTAQTRRRYNSSYNAHIPMQLRMVSLR
ncbi:Fc.00g082510.m01.CDS01 [Cosmosporella sp. VM-42]